MKKHIDAQTPRGQVALAWARKGVEKFLQAHPKYTWQETDQARYADVDGLLGCASDSRQVIKCVLESKARNFDANTLFGEYSGHWLISHDKIIRGYDVAFALRCDFMCLLVTTLDAKAYLTRLAKYNTETGGLEWTAKYFVRKTKTQKTINGGEAVRDNAFVDMTGIKPYDL